MKIEKEIIRITQIPNDFLIKLQPGNRYYVKVLDRLDQRHAVLDFQGMRIDAEFKNEIPAESLYIILQKKVNNTYYFKIDFKEKLINSDFIKQILDLTILNSGTFPGNILNKLKKINNQEIRNLRGIIDFNRILLGIDTINNRSDNILNFLNTLFHKGIYLPDLLLISELLNGNSKSIRQLILILLNIFQKSFREINKSNIYLQNKGKADVNSIINNIIDLLKDYPEKEKNDIIKSIMDYLSHNRFDDRNPGIQSGQVIFFNGENFRSCDYIIKTGNILLSLELTFLGQIDILIKEDESGCVVRFYCGKEETLPALRGKAAELESVIRKKYRKIHLSFYNTKLATEKIIANIMTINLNNIIDIKA